MVGSKSPSEHQAAVIHPTLRKSWPVLTILLCAAMLGILAGLQFVWTGQLSQAQGAMMETALANSVRQLELEIGREIAPLLFLFQPRGGFPRGDDWSSFAEDLDLWSQTSAYPHLLRRLLVYSESEGRRGALRELPLGENQPVKVAWDDELASLRPFLEGAGENREGSGREWRGFAWRLFPSAKAIVRAMPPRERLRRHPNRIPRLAPAGFLILVLDWMLTTELILPELVERFFAGPDGEQLYKVAVATSDGRRFLYRSDDSVDSKWLAAADIRRRLRLIGDPRPRPRGPQSPLDPIRRLGPEQGRGGRLREPAGWDPGAWRALNLGRVRLLVAGNGPPLSLEIAASHVSGPLAGVVAKQRVRNLATGMGVLLLLGGAMVLVVVSARRAKRLAEMQMEFIAGVTHELRTPLAVICSVGENLADGIVGASQQVKRYGELIRDHGRRLSDMVEHTLQFASMESREPRFHLVPIDVAVAVQAALNDARPMIEQAGFSLERGEQADLPMVLADEKAVQQILSNLLSNAVKYGRPGRWVRVETIGPTHKARTEVQIRVFDRGMGIPEGDQERIFDAFYRGAATAENNIQGSGLGLKLARDLALGMGCKISFRSDPRQGTMFALHLPVQPDSSA